MSLGQAYATGGGGLHAAPLGQSTCSVAWQALPTLATRHARGAAAGLLTGGPGLVDGLASVTGGAATVAEPLPAAGRGGLEIIGEVALPLPAASGPAALPLPVSDALPSGAGRGGLATTVLPPPALPPR